MRWVTSADGAAGADAARAASVGDGTDESEERDAAGWGVAETASPAVGMPLASAQRASAGRAEEVDATWAEAV